MAKHLMIVLDIFLLISGVWIFGYYMSDSILDNDIRWFDTGTIDSLLDSSQFIAHNQKIIIVLCLV